LEEKVIWRSTPLAPPATVEARPPTAAVAVAPLQVTAETALSGRAVRAATTWVQEVEKVLSAVMALVV